MYFFTELAKTNTQLSADNDAYGPVSGSLTTKYETGANLQLTAVARAFAMQDAMMIVQPNISDTNLVNVILRPLEGLDVSSETVQYYVYRGLQKTDFITSGAVTKPGTTEFITKYWNNWTTYVDETNYTGPEPTPREAFAYDDTPALSDDVLIENIFNNSIAGVRAIKVSAGEWLGNFTNIAKINFEIIINSEHRSDIDINHPDYLRMDLGLFRKPKNIVDVTDVDPSNLLTTKEKAFKLKVRREEILSFIDPAAFFGMHYYNSVKEIYNDGGTWKTRKLKKQDLYDNLISKFDTKTRVYIDIRSEFGYSLTFYDNYNLNPLNDVLMIKSDSTTNFIPDLYNTHEWPIFYESNWVGTNPMNRVWLKFRAGKENKKPVGYLDNPRLKGAFNKKKFFEWRDLPKDPSPDYTDPLLIKFPNDNVSNPGANIAQYIRLQYFRQQSYDGDFGTQVLNPIGTLSQAFASLKLASIDGLSAVFKHNKSQRLQLVKGNDFLFTSHPESYQDGTNILFLTEIEYSGKKSTFKRPKGLFVGNNITESSVFPQDMAFQKVKIRENDGSGSYNDVYILQLVKYRNKKKKSTHKEDVFTLGISNTQYANLIAAAVISGITERHSIFIQFTPEMHLPEENGIAYNKYKLSLIGLNKEGTVTTAIPSIDIFVYTQDECTVASIEFSAAKSIPEGYPDPAIIKQWDHIGTWHYRVLNDFEPKIEDYGNNSGIAPPFKVNLNANVFYPTDIEGVTDPANISSIQVNYPLIVIVHGNGQFYAQYDRLAKHLAQNGFIAASIDLTLIGDSPILNSITGYAPYDFSFDSTYSTDKYGYNSVSNEICLYDRVTDSFPVSNKLSWKNPADFTIVTVGSDQFVKFSNSIKAYGGYYGMGAVGRANVLFHHLETIKVKFGATVKNSIGLIGHSRGGEAIVTAERLINTQNIANLSGIDQIDALFSLSPTDQYQIERLNAVPYFVMYGSKDGDVKAAGIDSRPDPYDLNTSKMVVGRTGFSLWDRAENQKKTMVFVHGATHNGFTTFNYIDYNTIGVGLGKGKGITSSDFIADEGIQRTILDAYANAFFRKTLKSEEFWFDIISGKWIPPSAEDTNVKLHFQYKHTGTVVIKDYDSVTDDSDLSDGIGTGILKTSISGITMDDYSQHGMKSVIIDTSKVPTYGVYSGISINASAFNFISFRITKKYGIPIDLTTMELVLYNGGTAFKQKAPIRVPETYTREDLPSRSKSAMITLRFPLSGFSGLDKTNITKVELSFGTASGNVELSDFEFTD